MAQLLILGDAAYPLLTWLMKPYTGRTMTPEEESFGVYLSSTRIVVENAFGRLKARWRCLAKQDTDYQFVPQVISACCVLHNIVEMHKERFRDTCLSEVDRGNQMFPQTAMEAIQHPKETTAVDLAALLDAGDDAVVTLVAGDTLLAAHRAVLVDRSPVFAAMFAHNMSEASSGQVTIADVEGPVLRQLLSYLYTLRAPQQPHMAPQLLVAADKYGVSGLKAACEQQVAAQLSVETAAATAVMAVRHSCQSLREASIRFIKDHNYQVMATQGWACAMRSHTDDLIEVNRLLAEPPAEISTPDPAESGTSHQRHSGDSRHSGAATSARHTPPPDNATVSRLRSLPAEEKGRKLIQAAERGAVGELEALLAAGADVASTGGDVRRWTALHWAARGGHVEAARLLVARGAPVDARNNWQWTPLHLAAGWGHAAVVRLLLDASANHSARTRNGRTPLVLGRQNNHQEVVDLLSAR